MGGGQGGDRKTAVVGYTKWQSERLGMQDLSFCDKEKN